MLKRVDTGWMDRNAEGGLTVRIFGQIFRRFVLITK